jgi:hypothetical protein
MNIYIVMQLLGQFHPFILVIINNHQTNLCIRTASLYSLTDTEAHS